MRKERLFFVKLGGKLFPAMDAELLIDAAESAFDRAGGQTEGGGDFWVRFAAKGVLGQLALSRHTTFGLLTCYANGVYFRYGIY